ncbi:hypothetical protein E4U33_007925 [Claviceps sp. LM78 group G4]|nr:hypothetical protein E4U33_007925 [Claviceps sp. LM78 group G4]
MTVAFYNKVDADGKLEKPSPVSSHGAWAAVVFVYGLRSDPRGVPVRKIGSDAGITYMWVDSQGSRKTPKLTTILRLKTGEETKRNRAGLSMMQFRHATIATGSQFVNYELAKG